MKIKVWYNKNGECPHCGNTGKITYVAELLYKHKLIAAYRCTHCRRIIWGK